MSLAALPSPTVPTAMSALEQPEAVAADQIALDDWRSAHALGVVGGAGIEVNAAVVIDADVVIAAGEARRGVRSLAVGVESDIGGHGGAVDGEVDGARGRAAAGRDR